MEVIAGWGTALVNLAAILLQQSSTTDALPLTVIGGIVTIIVGLFATLSGRSKAENAERTVIATIAGRSVERITELVKAEQGYRAQITDLQAQNFTLKQELAVMTARAQAAEVARDKPLPSQGLPIP